MNVYSDELAKKYTNERSSIKNADTTLFCLMEEIGITGKNILDLGCGDGTNATKILHAGAESVVGIDISPAMVELARSQNKEIEFVLGDASSMPFESNSFDFVFSSFALQHCKNLAVVMCEISRVMKKSGYFVAVFNTVETDNESLFNAEMPILLGATNDIVVYDLIKTDKEAKDAIRDSGLHLIKYEEDVAARAIIDPNFKHFADIRKLKAMVCLCKKP